MKDDFSDLKAALNYAIQMELDGKQFYLNLGKLTNNKLGKELFAWLAAQEDRHREHFQEIFRSLVDVKNWQETKITPAKLSKPQTIFAQAARAATSTNAPGKEESDAVEKAMDMEIKSRDFYRQQSSIATSDVQRKFFDSITVEEQGHYLYLVDYKEYIEDPSDWFTRTEHHLLDGA
jgi:rubrerythrin